MNKHLTNNIQKLLDKHWGVHVGIIVVLLLFIGYAMNIILLSDEALFVTNNSTPAEPTLITGSYRAPAITADSAIVWDVRKGEAIYEKDADKRMPLASITKVMSALTALEQAPRDTIISIDNSSLAQDGDSGLIQGERWSLQDLVNFSLIESSNDGIAAVASAVGALREGVPEDRGAGRVSFIDLMNNKAEELGLENTYFENESGLDIWNETEAGSYGSAEDVAKLFSHILITHPEIFEATTKDTFSFRSLSGNTHIAQNTNRALDSIPGLIGSKTGYTDISGGNLGVVVDPGINYPFIIVVLGSTFEERFNDVVALSESTLEYLSPLKN